MSERDNWSDQDWYWQEHDARQGKRFYDANRAAFQPGPAQGASWDAQVADGLPLEAWERVPALGDV